MQRRRRPNRNLFVSESVTSRIEPLRQPLLTAASGAPVGAVARAKPSREVGSGRGKFTVRAGSPHDHWLNRDRLTGISYCDPTVSSAQHTGGTQVATSEAVCETNHWIASAAVTDRANQWHTRSATTDPDCR